MTEVRSWLTAVAAAVLTGSVMGILVIPATSSTGSGPIPAAVLNPPASRIPPPTTSATPAPPRGLPTPAPTRAATGDPVRTAVVPTGLIIPDLDIDLPIAAVGVRPDGQMEVPENPWVAGWYRYRAAPSDPTGAVVIAAHVDSRRFGIGPFAELSRLRPGQEVIVTTEAGMVKYRVTDLEVIGKDALPLNQVFDRGGDPRLHLVTCAGAFSSRTGWDSNLVVVASPVQ
ncbi:sortase domain-containing protein [Granulicoccus sp. GXG6511]|uniref:class F sortase n=1 Tax=Granulicoccus sp. GXG6511 TaxID=3381351 RepID=UPI003D7C6B92